MEHSLAAVIRFVLAITLTAAPSFAGLVKVWTLQELAKAPVLTVCRVERIRAGAEAPRTTLRWRAGMREMRALLTVVRSLPVLEKSAITLNYYSYGIGPGGEMAGDPTWPRLAPDDIRVFPLVQVSGRWRLAMEEGRGVIMPAIAPPRPEAPSTAGYDFLAGELVNNLSWGSYRDLYDTALYLRELEWAVVPETLMPLLRQNIATDWQRWADIATSSLATLGIPRRSLAEIRSAEPPRSLATFALRQLSERDYPELVVRGMIGHADVHEWGSAATLQEFANDPLVRKLMPDRLQTPSPGSLYVASSIIHQDPRSPLIPIALEAAFKVVRSPGGTHNDRFAAVNLILEKGSDTQFGVLLDAFRAAQRNDAKLYYEIFSAVQMKEHPRVIKICALMLGDRRVFSGEMRYCDLAGASLQMLSKEKFGFGPWNQPLGERDQAVERASAWMKGHSAKGK